MKNVITAITITLISSGMMLLLQSAAIAGGVIAIDEQLDEYWLVEKKVAPRYPMRALNNGIMGCAAVGYIIEADGSTSNHKVLAFYSSTVFDNSAIKAAKKFRYRPAEQNPDKISTLTINVFTYEITTGKDVNGDSETREKLVDVCKTDAKKVLEPHMGTRP